MCFYPSKTNNDQTPEELYIKKCPNVSHLRIYGWLAYDHVLKTQ